MREVAAVAMTVNAFKTRALFDAKMATEPAPAGDVPAPVEESGDT